MTRFRRTVIVATVTVLAGVLAALTPVGWTLEESLGLAWLFKLRGSVAAPDEVLIVGISRQSARRLDLPAQMRDWPRSIHARLVDSLTAQGTAVIVLDIALSAPSKAEEDRALAAAMARAGRVVLFEAIEVENLAISDRTGASPRSIRMERIVPPLPLFAEAAHGAASFPLPKVPARVSQFWAFVPGDNDVPTLPSLAFEMYTLADGGTVAAREGESARPPRNGADDLEPAAPADLVQRRNDAATKHSGKAAEASSGAALPAKLNLASKLRRLRGGPQSHYLNLYGPPGTIRTIPYEDVLSGGSDGGDRLDLKGRVVFVGFSDLSGTTFTDTYPTVFSRPNGVDMSGVEIAATAFDNLVSDTTIRPMDGATGLCVLLLFGAALGACIFGLRPAIAVPIATLAGAGYFIAVFMVFARAQLWMPLASPLLMQLPLTLFAGLLWQYAGASRERKNLSDAIRYYLPEKVARDLPAGRLDPRSANELVYGVCLATDAEGFTTLAEEVAPRAVAVLLNEYLDTLIEPVVRTGGFICEIVGDGLMCAWALKQPPSVLRATALGAAIDAAAAVELFNRRHDRQRLPTRFGLHAGEIAVGYVGGRSRVTYSVVGDVANTSARIEGLNKQLGTRVLASEAVVYLLDGFLTRRVGCFRFAGKAHAVDVFEVLARDEEGSQMQRQLCAEFALALKSLEAERWTEAIDRLTAVLDAFPNDGPARFHLERCRRWCAEPALSDPAGIVCIDAK